MRVDVFCKADIPPSAQVQLKSRHEVFQIPREVMTGLKAARGSAKTIYLLETMRTATEYKAKASGLHHQGNNSESFAEFRTIASESLLFSKSSSGVHQRRATRRNPKRHGGCRSHDENDNHDREKICAVQAGTCGPGWKQPGWDGLISRSFVGHIRL